MPDNLKNQLESIIWSNKFSIGFPDIDAQHKKIIELINILIEYYNQNIMSGNVGDICDQLLFQTYQHFIFEETLLKELGYHEKDFNKHLDMHQLFKDIATELVIKALGEDTQQVSYEVLYFIKNWCETHILKEDMKYKDFLHKQLNG